MGVVMFGWLGSNLGAKWSKSEFRDPKQIQSSNVTMTETGHRFHMLEAVFSLSSVYFWIPDLVRNRFWSFDVVSNFEFRISIFEF